MEAFQQQGRHTIEINKVSKWYGDVSALNDVSLTIGPGVSGLLGPNGAGKSTLLKLMSGQLEPSLGSVHILGQRFQNNPGLFHHIGLCPEQDSLWEELSGPSFLTAMLELQGWPHRDAHKRSHELIGLFDLTKAGTRRVSGYSKGMRQKLRIAQSLAHQPKVLFLDEPMSGLDATSRTLVADIVRELGETGVTVVISSHVLHEVENITKEVIIINQGSLRARGNVYEIRELLADHPLQLELRVSDPRRFSRACMAKNHVVKVELDPNEKDRVLVFTQHQNQFFQDLYEILEAEDLAITSLHAEDEDMEAVFNYLIK
ncbi:ABC transporter ATP-binding protein [Acanthopleuribacter pedis]|uniref:ABC transporter ATP-binding protein n=1 Tax=Acanthopleuribacter pedis TaxID=442870 RepID=A0A8J7Q679_9BACT|nr:ABC transporter ATP-binding protein [Acanthopleuribacter pedis]MBO1318811.1 ABC transporter ATP-binding protein [Acanthopleuribacter pedis]